ADYAPTRSAGRRRRRRRAVQSLRRELHAPGLVNVDNFDFDRITNFDHVGHALHVAVAELTHVAEPFDTRENLDERTELFHRFHGAGVDPSDLGLGRHAADA